MKFLLVGNHKMEVSPRVKVDPIEFAHHISKSTFTFTRVGLVGISYSPPPPHLNQNLIKFKEPSDRLNSVAMKLIENKKKLNKQTNKSIKVKRNLLLPSAIDGHSKFSFGALASGMLSPFKAILLFYY